MSREQQLRVGAENITRLHGALRSELNTLSVQDIRNAAAAAGLDVSQITAKSEARSGLGSRAEVMPWIDRLFRDLSAEAKVTALCIPAERVMVGARTDRVQQRLGRHGFRFVGGTCVPTAVLDGRESRFLPPNAARDIARAMARLVEGDESGAITAACGAVDLTTHAVYQIRNPGDPGAVAFQAKVNTAMKELEVSATRKADFLAIGIEAADASTVAVELRKATNHVAQALQALRRVMCDVHGSRPALRRTAYHAIKLAAAICGLMEGPT